MSKRWKLMGIFRSSEPDQEQMMEKQARQNMHQSNFGTMEQGDNTPDKEYLREITEEQVDDSTLELMANMFSHDFVLSNLKDAEVTEIKWLARVVARKIKRMHPSSESFAAGEQRKIVFDDETAGLGPLSPHQENLIDQAVLDFLTRPPRSRGGWQQDEVSKQLKVSKVEDKSENSSSGGLFSR